MSGELHQLSAFDPDHLPEEIQLTEGFHHRFPDLPQVACFDAAFHHDLPRATPQQAQDTHMAIRYRFASLSSLGRSRPSRFAYRSAGE